MTSNVGDSDYKLITTAADVDSIRHMIEYVHDGWYPEGPIDWEDFIDRLEGSDLDGKTIDMGEDMGSPAISRVKAIVRELRRDS